MARVSKANVVSSFAYHFELSTWSVKEYGLKTRTGKLCISAT